MEKITDSVKALARIHGVPRSAIREVASDLRVQVRYSADRRTWFVDEPYPLVRAFNEHLTELFSGELGAA